MARRDLREKYRVAETETPETSESGLAVSQPEEKKSVLFGSRADRKAIIVMSIVGFLVMALAYYVVAAAEGSGISIPALLFTAFHGALLGMLLGQLIFVYPDNIMIIFTLLTVVIGETAYVFGLRRPGKPAFDIDDFLATVAVFFWAGFVGFWVGFLVYVKRVRARQRFRRRYETRQAEEQLPPDA